MRKHLVSVIVAICVLMTSAFALTREQINTADALNSLGLFNGTDSGYQLNVQLKRSDGITLLVRLLGKEAEATSGKYSHPFTDVAEWLDPYVACAYEAGYTTGTGATTYGSDNTMSRNEFYTVVLRALGYTDAGETPDFTWSDAAAFGKTVGLSDSDMAKTKFSRADAIEVFWKAMDAELKGQSKTLGEKLLADGVFTAAELAEAEKLQSNPYPNEEMVVSERTGNLVTKRQMMVEKAAFAYWDKRMDTDYDQRAFVHTTAYDNARANTRRENRSQPEWASPEHMLFLDCSAYQFCNYRNVYGEEMTKFIPWYNTTNTNSHAKEGTADDVIYYYEFKDHSKAEHEKVAAEILALLEPGDLFNYRRASSGHVVMYLDGGRTLESGGSSYYVGKGRDGLDPNGTVKYRDIGYFFDLSRSTNILGKNNLASISIIRPLNVLGSLDPLPRAEARLETGRLALSKLCVAPGQTVEPGQTLTFRIVLDNQPETETSKDLVLNVTDVLPTNINLVSISHGGELIDGVITWKDLRVANNEVKTLTYTAVVAAQEGFVESGTTLVNGIDFEYRPLQIGKKMTASQFATLKAKIDEGMAEGQTAEEFVNSVYEAAVGTDLGFNSIEDMIAQLYTPQLDGGGNPRYRIDIKEDSKLGKGAVYNYVWGRRVLNMTTDDYKQRTRYIFEESFQKGDLLIMQDLMMRGMYYIYLGEDAGFVKVTDMDGIEYASSYDTTELILSQRFYAIIRPSMI